MNQGPDAGISAQKRSEQSVRSFPRRSGDCLRDLALSFRILFVPLCVSFSAALILSAPGQTLEYYRIVLENLADPWLLGIGRAQLEALLPLVGLAATAACLFFSTRVLISLRARATHFRTKSIPYGLTYMPTVLGVLPMLGFEYGLLKAWLSFDANAASQAISAIRDFGDDRFATQLEILIRWMKKVDPVSVRAMVVGAGLAVVGGGVLFAINARYAKAMLSPTDRHWPLIRALTLYVMALTIVLCIVIVGYPVQLGQAIGAPSLVMLFICCLTLILTGLAVFSTRIEFPLIAVLIAWAVGLALFDLNDNHQLRRVDAEGRPVVDAQTRGAAEVRLPTIGKAFEEWYQARADKSNSEYERSGYPVYIVAAQGGGIYAAAQALQFLTSLQTTCERFAQHLFAISGVSGGSVGAALYSALSGEFEPTSDQCREVREIIGHGPRTAEMEAVQQAAFELVRNDYDFLSPLLAAALFPDFAQRFLWPPFGKLSRARALEQAVSDAWKDIASRRFNDRRPDALERGVVASWAAAGVGPALVFNTTETSSGRRRVIAPFRFEASVENDIQLLPISRDHDVPVSAAAVASARFPWLTPAAWFWGARHTRGTAPQSRGEITKYRVVDGGYFENSGVATAVDLIENLEAVAREKRLNVKFHLIALTSGGYPDHRFYGLGEAISPLVALFNSQQARTYSTIELARRKLGAIDPRAKGPDEVLSRIARLQRVDFGDFVIPLPLGWRLSKAAATQIFFLTGRINHCTPDEKFEQTSKILGFGSADCVKRLVLHQLRGDTINEALKEARQEW